MRTPSDRGASWDHWRRRLAGEDLPITTEPQPGLYKCKLRGHWVAVQIDLKQPTDENGELTGDEAFVAFVNGEPDDADCIWSWCADHPISQAEFDRIERMPAVTDLSRQVVV